MRVSFHPEAEEELEEAQKWYEERSFLAASAFLYEVSIAIRRLSEAPLRYPRGEHGTRRVSLERFPFTIFYRTRDEEIVIVAVAHQKRRPNYWATR